MITHKPPRPSHLALRKDHEATDLNGDAIIQLTHGNAADKAEAKSAQGTTFLLVKVEGVERDTQVGFKANQHYDNSGKCLQLIRGLPTSIH